MIRLLDISFADPAQNLALDEYLLDAAERGTGGDALRFWESPMPFVVLGTGQVLAEEVYAEHCAADGVPIYRRCSAGGCVLQGPGSLNFTLVLTVDNHPDVKSLHRSYMYVLGRIAEAFGKFGLDVSRQGISDLAFEGRKVSGNAQRRRRRAILHHGTLLYQADYGLYERYLREPKSRPDYRGAKTHREFVGALPLDPDALRAVVRPVFGATTAPGTLSAAEQAAIAALAAGKYATREWTYRR